MVTKSGHSKGSWLVVHLYVWKLTLKFAGASGGSIVTVGDTGVAPQGIWPICVNVYVPLKNENETFLWNMACLCEKVLWWLNE